MPEGFQQCRVSLRSLGPEIDIYVDRQGERERERERERGGAGLENKREWGRRERS